MTLAFYLLSIHPNVHSYFVSLYGKYVVSLHRTPPTSHGDCVGERNGRSVFIDLQAFMRARHDIIGNKIIKILYIHTNTRRMMNEKLDAYKIIDCVTWGKIYIFFNSFCMLGRLFIAIMRNLFNGILVLWLFCSGENSWGWKCFNLMANVWMLDKDLDLNNLSVVGGILKNFDGYLLKFRNLFRKKKLKNFNEIFY